jgi:hypothetical protein
MARENKKKNFPVDGFSFTNEEEAKQAQKEAEGVKYIREKTDMDTPEMVLQIYNRMIEQELFETAVGYSYLKELQDYLLSIPFVDKGRVMPIPIQHPVLEADIQKKYQEDPRVQRKEKKEQRLKEQQEKEQQEKERRMAESLKPASQKKVLYVNYRRRYQVAAFTCIVLALCVVGMFFVTSTTNNATILNYETEIIDKYEAWEEELNEREAALEERESEIGQD